MWAALARAIYTTYILITKEMYSHALALVLSHSGNIKNNSLETLWNSDLRQAVARRG